MAKSNADRMFESYMDSAYYYNKTDKIRCFNDTDIFVNDTQIGFIEGLECEDGSYHQFVILSLQFFKTYKVQIKQIIKGANKVGYFVLFVDSIDIGFGRPQVFENRDIHIKRLLDIYKMSNHKGLLKNAGGIVDDYYDDSTNNYYTRSLYTMSQDIDEAEYEPDDILYLYLTGDNKHIYSHKLYLLFAPPAAYMRNLINSGIYLIYYFKTSLYPYSSYDYDFFDSIYSKQILSFDGRPIRIDKLNSKEVEKFFAKED